MRLHATGPGCTRSVPLLKLQLLCAGFCYGFHANCGADGGGEMLAFRARIGREGERSGLMGRGR